MGNISLTSSMRSNLQSLQSIAKNQNVVQNRLATGLKVSSAIDNPSSFYTAQSLNNRSADLGALLDSMSQGIQTIKAATQAIDIASKMLEQAKASANKALEKIAPESPHTIVTTKAELESAINNGDALVVVKGSIDMGDEELIMQDGQKLVGENYLKSGSPTSKITFNKSTNANGIIVGNNTEISDLSLELTTTAKDNGQGLIFNNEKSITLRNLDLRYIDNSNSTYKTGAVFNKGNAVVKLESVINIKTDGNGNYNSGIRNDDDNTKLTQLASSNLNITTSNENGYGIANGTNVLNGTVNITTFGVTGYGISLGNNTINGIININTKGKYGYGLNAGVNTINGILNIVVEGEEVHGIHNGTNTLSSTAKLLIETKHNTAYTFRNSNIKYSSGASVGIKNAKTNTDAWWKADWSDGSQKSISGTLNTLDGVDGWVKKGTFTDLAATLNNVMSSAVDASSSSARDIATLGRNDNNGVFGRNDALLNGSSQYSSILDQFNQLIKDGGYKGINLLLEQNLKINFNEDRSSGIDVKGVDASTKGLGVETFSWKSAEDIEKSIAELDFAISKLRGFSAEFGNSFSIVSTREDFTAAMVNVLTEGADKLTLADMNQESANMLALQTRQQLAVNSLSLASRAAQSVLKLF